MKAALWLRKDHEKVQEILKEFRKAPHFTQTDKRALFEEMRRVLSLHMNIEDEVFYSEVRNSSTSRNTTELVDSLAEEHQKIQDLLQEIPTGNAQGNDKDKQAEARIPQLIDLIDAHFQR